MTYRELAEKIKGFTEAQLSQEVMLDMCGIPIQGIELECLNEDLYDTDNESLEPMSAYTDPNITDDPMDEKEFYELFENPIHWKGEIFLTTHEEEYKDDPCAACCHYPCSPLNCLDFKKWEEENKRNRTSIKKIDYLKGEKL